MLNIESASLLVERTKKRKTLSARKVRFAWGWLIPMLIYYTVLSTLPIVFVILLGFVDWNGIYFEDILWVGMKNYITIFTQTKYFKMFLNSLIMGVSISAINIILSFFVAMLMMAPIKGRIAYRTIWYIPCVVSTAVVSQLVTTILNPSTGLLNNILIKMGKEPIMWQLSTFWMFFWIILVSIWQGLGGTMILFMAGLAGIPQELYEAGDIDGTNRWQRLIHITLPGIKQMFAFILITASMGVFNIFAQVQLISAGGPFNSTMVIMYQIYDEAFLNMNVGMSSSLSVIVLILAMIITVLNMKVTGIDLKGRD